MAALRKQLKRGDQSLIGNKGYRKYVRNTGPRFQIDEAKIAWEARFDGKWVLQSDMEDLSAEELDLKYKQLWMVEAIFRSAKSLLETRPIFHKRDETIRGHVFCSFLALVLQKELYERLALQGDKFEWAEILRDLTALRYVDVEHEGKQFRIRTEVEGTCTAVCRATGVAIPPTVQPITLS